MSIDSVGLDMTHIQYQGETLPVPPFPLVLAFHLVLHNFYIYPDLSKHTAWKQKKRTATSFNCGKTDFAR